MNWEIVQPQGVIVHLSGKPSNLAVNFASDQGSFSFNDLAPDASFYLQPPNYESLVSMHYTYQHGTRRIGLPTVRILRETVLNTLHEIGHHKLSKNPARAKKIRQAAKLLGAILF